MHNEEKYITTTRTIAWAAFIFSALAMFFAIISFNRSNGDYSQNRNTDSSWYREKAENEAAGLQARAELIVLETKLRAAQAGEDISAEVRSTKERIREIYADKGSALRNEGRQMDIDLEQIEREVRTNTAQGLEKLQNLINKLESNIRTDEK